MSLWIVGTLQKTLKDKTCVVMSLLMWKQQFKQIQLKDYHVFQNQNLQPMSSRHPICHWTSTVCYLLLQKPVIICSIWFHDVSALCFASLAFTSAGNTHSSWHQDVSASRHLFLAKAYCRQGFWHGCCCPLLSTFCNHSTLLQPKLQFRDVSPPVAALPCFLSWGHL